MDLMEYKKGKRSGGVHIREDSEEVAVGKCEIEVSNSHLLILREFSEMLAHNSIDSRPGYRKGYIFMNVSTDISFHNPLLCFMSILPIFMEIPR